MAAPPIIVNRFDLPPQRAAGTQLAPYRTRSGLPGRAGWNRMVAKIALAVAAILAIAPAVATIVWPDNREQAPSRAVELHGPILGFTQSSDRIQVRLVPARTDVEKAA